MALPRFPHAPCLIARNSAPRLTRLELDQYRRDSSRQKEIADLMRGPA
jgi:hypothetical protein